MKKAFEVDTCLVCDYATQDTASKFVFGGVYLSDITFIEAPPTWPNFSVFLSLQPVRATFDFWVSFRTPRSDPLFQLSGKCEGEEPGPDSRIALLVQVPPMPFTGPGAYWLEAGLLNQKPHFSKMFQVKVGQSESRQAPSITAVLKAG